MAILELNKLRTARLVWPSTRRTNHSVACYRYPWNIILVFRTLYTVIEKLVVCQKPCGTIAIYNYRARSPLPYIDGELCQRLRSQNKNERRIRVHILTFTKVPPQRRATASDLDIRQLHLEPRNSMHGYVGT